MTPTTRCRYIPKDSTAVEHPEGLGIAYTYEKAGKFVVIAYRGKAGKSCFHYSYRRPEERDEKIAAWFKAMSDAADYKRKLKAERSKPQTKD